jgi:hypothetical protein
MCDRTKIIDTLVSGGESGGFERTYAVKAVRKRKGTVVQRRSAQYARPNSCCAEPTVRCINGPVGAECELKICLRVYYC